MIARSPASPSPSLLSPDSVPLPLRYFDCMLVVAFLPFALLAGLPALGALVGAVAWIAQRAFGVWLDGVAARSGDFRRATALTFAQGLLRPFVLAITILVVGKLGERSDGLMAAVLVLVAFTIYLALSFIFRPQRNSST